MAVLNLRKLQILPSESTQRSSSDQDVQRNTLSASPSSSRKESTSSPLTTSSSVRLSTATPSSAINHQPGTTSSTSTASEPAFSDISWGPAITASPYPSTLSSSGSPPSSQPSQQKSGNDSQHAVALGSRHQHLPISARDGIIAGVTVGGVLLVLLVSWIFWRRRRSRSTDPTGARNGVSISKFPSPGLADDPTVSNSILRETIFSLRSSRHNSLRSDIKNPVPRTDSVTPLPNTARTPSRATRKKSTKSSKRAPVSDDINRPASVEPMLSNRDRPKVYRYLGIDPVDVSEADEARFPHSTRGTDSEDVQWHDVMMHRSHSLEFPHRFTDRWSWTNSQAPPTPRIKASDPRDI